MDSMKLETKYKQIWSSKVCYKYIDMLVLNSRKNSVAFTIRNNDKKNLTRNGNSKCNVIYLFKKSLARHVWISSGYSEVSFCSAIGLSFSIGVSPSG
jgi:hypothetical protein